VDPGPELVVHAWAERNDLVFGTMRGQQAQVEGEGPIPEPTEFAPVARRLVGSLDRLGANQHLAGALAPKPTLGSLAGAASVKSEGVPFFHADEYEYGQIVVVGAYRLADGEVADYSSGGPQRHVPEHSDGTPATVPDAAQTGYQQTGSAARQAPDADAPADAGPSMRGLRTIGTRAGSHARLSGTSAAAPSVTRLIANARHVVAWWGLLPENQPGGEVFGAVPPDRLPQPDARPTPTPQRDDRFRRGRWRVR
jgi:hypothetical protein